MRWGAPTSPRRRGTNLRREVLRKSIKVQRCTLKMQLRNVALLGRGRQMDEICKTCRTCKSTKPETAYRGTRSECKSCECARRRAWYAAQAVKPHKTDEGTAYYRAWYEANAETVKARAVAWAAANPDKRREVCKANMARQRDKLSDAYVRRMLAASMGLKAGDIPQPLADCQRELLRLKRAINEKRG